MMFMNLVSKIGKTPMTREPLITLETLEKDLFRNIGVLVFR